MDIEISISPKENSNKVAYSKKSGGDEIIEEIKISGGSPPKKEENNNSKAGHGGSILLKSHSWKKGMMTQVISNEQIKQALLSPQIMQNQNPNTTQNSGVITDPLDIFHYPVTLQYQIQRGPSKNFNGYEEKERILPGVTEQKLNEDEIKRRLEEDREVDDELLYN